MPVELLERDEVLAGVMPGYGDDLPGGDEAGEPKEPVQPEEEEPEGDPS